MEIKGSQHYSAGVDKALALFQDPDATRARYESMGHRDVVIECSEDDGVVRIVASRVVDVELPGFAKKVLKPTNAMVQTDEWRAGVEGAWTGTFNVEIKGAPVHMKGTMLLVPETDGCRHDVTIDVQVKVPIVGGKIADWVGKNDARRTLDAELAFNAARLAGE